MPTYRHLELLSSGPVSRVRLVNQWPAYHEQEIRELVAEWNSVAEAADCRTIFMDCSNVKILSSEMLSKLILLQRRLAEKQGKLILCGIRGEVREVLSWTKLDQFFEIREDAEQDDAVTFGVSAAASNLAFGALAMDSARLRLLLIEDNPIDARVIGGYLAQAKGVATELETVELLSLGMDRLRDGHFDALLLDLNLPDSMGLGTVEQVHACHPKVPIVVLTGEDAEGLALQAVQAGAEDYLSKSELDPKLLLRMIRYAIERAGHRRADQEYRDRAEKTTGENERRYRELLAAVTNYTYSVTLENGLPVATDHSWGCFSITGYTPEDYKADPYLWIKMVHPADQETVRQYVAAILGGEKVPAIEHRIIRPDGAVRWLRDTIVPHHDDEMLVRYDGLVEDVTDRRRAEQSLREQEIQLPVAQKIQERLLPGAPPRLPGFDIGGGSYPAEFTGGDFFDYLAMPNGAVGFAVSDVSGHGFGPALLMASASTLIRLLAETHTDLGEILARVNRFLAKETDDRFVTLLLACLDPRSRTFRYASGGHPTGYILDSMGAVKAHLKSMAPPLAIFPAAEFPVADPVTLVPGDIVVLLTDGIQEAISPAGEPFGTARLLDAVRTHRTRTAAQIVEDLYQAVCDFSQRRKPADDVTMVVIKAEI